MLALDQGTSGTKALVVCPERGVIASAYVPLAPDYGADGSVEIDPELLWGSVVEAGRRALATAGEGVCAVGLANQGETVLAWQRSDGRPLTPAIVWQDTRSAQVCADLLAADDAVTERLERLCGLRLDPYFAAPKMAWVRRNLSREGVVTTSDSWLVHRLCEAFVTDASTASRTMLVDLDAVAWSGAALSAFGLDGEALPTIVDACGPVGITHVFDDAVPGAPMAGVPVTGLLVDQQAALLAEGCLDAGQAKCTYGTGAFLLTTTGQSAIRSRHGLAACVAWRLAGQTTYCLDGQVFAAGSALRWLTEIGILAGPDDLDAVAETVPDSASVRFVPALAGLAAPRWRRDARGLITGLGLDTTRGHVARAFCDGLAAEVAVLAATTVADLRSGLDVVRVDGGLTRSAVLMQTQADLLQRPVECYPLPDATALGAAAVAMLGVAMVGETQARDLRQVLPRWAPSAVYEPAIGADQAAERLERHRAAVQLALNGSEATA